MEELTGMALIRSKWGMMSKVAKGLGKGLAAVSVWREVPPHLVLKIESITGIPREELCPELYDFSGRKVTAVEVAEK